MSNERENRNQSKNSSPREHASAHVAEALTRLPRSADLHLDHRCNYRCKFCYFTAVGHIESVGPARAPTLDRLEYLRVQELLAEAGIERLTYAGGEPTLSPYLEELILHWHHLHGGTRPLAMIVTNGTGLLEARVRRFQDALAAVKLSGESNDNLVEVAIGRGYGSHVELIVNRADMLHRLGIPVHLNSVICSRNWNEDLTPLVRRINPTTWKVFQFLPVPGQNDAHAQELRISREEFRRFLEAHSHLRDIMVPEDNDLMRGSYVMIDPLGRFFQSTAQGYIRSANSILDVGVSAALAEVELDWEKYQKRGGDERAFGARKIP